MAGLGLLTAVDRPETPAGESPLLLLAQYSDRDYLDLCGPVSGSAIRGGRGSGRPAPAAVGSDTGPQCVPASDDAAGDYEGRGRGAPRRPRRGRSGGVIDQRRSEGRANSATASSAVTRASPSALCAPEFVSPNASQHVANL